VESEFFNAFPRRIEVGDDPIGDLLIDIGSYWLSFLGLTVANATD
jgi:hypothetical protein